MIIRRSGTIPCTGTSLPWQRHGTFKRLAYPRVNELYKYRNAEGNGTVRSATLTLNLPIFHFPRALFVNRESVRLHGALGRLGVEELFYENESVLEDGFLS